MTESALYKKSARAHKISRLLAALVIVAGALFIVIGATAWGVVRAELADQKVSVSDDAPILGGASVADPFSAIAQAQAISIHVNEMSGGKTYAQLDREDPLRATLLDAASIRTSLFTSAIAFGVSAFAMGVGGTFLLLGSAVLLRGRPQPFKEV